MPTSIASSVVVAALVATAPPPETPTHSDMLAAFYGNTLVTLDGGIKAYFYYNPDHTFTGKVPAFLFVLKGTWNVNDKGELCRVFDPLPPTITNPDCGPLLVHQIDETASDKTGHRERLVAGIRQ